MKWKVVLKSNEIFIGERKLIRDQLETIGFWLIDIKQIIEQTVIYPDGVLNIPAPMFIPWSSVCYIQEVV